MEPPPIPEVDENTVALIIGGYWNHPDGNTMVSGTELFGCPGSVDPETGEYMAIPIDDYPENVYMTAGVYYEEEGVDAPDEGKAMVCGGLSCNMGM